MTALPVPPREVIEQQARDAAARGESLRAACPYPFSSPEGVHFAAIYLLAAPAPGGSGESKQ
jgi:hypothetical protein